jgi:hypothetical protein
MQVVPRPLQRITYITLNFEPFTPELHPHNSELETIPRNALPS